MPLVKTLFERLFQDGKEYRTTTVVIGKLEPDELEQPELFEDRLRIDKLANISRAVDTLNERFGKHTLSLGPSLFLDQHRKTARDEHPVRKSALLPGETRRQRLTFPRLFVKV